MTSNRSNIHLLRMIAMRFEGRAPKDMVATVTKFAAELEARRHDKRFVPDAEIRQIERQQSLFSTLPDCAAVDRLKEAMLQRAYDLLWDGDGNGCDALLEFLPSKDGEAMLDAWMADHDDDVAKSRFHQGVPA